MQMLYAFSSTSADGLMRVPATMVPGDWTVVVWRHWLSSWASSSLVMPGFHQESLLSTDAQAVTTNPRSTSVARRAVIDGPLERIVDKCRCGHGLREAPGRALLERSWRWSTSTGPSPTPRRIRWVLHRRDTRRPAFPRVLELGGRHPRSEP